MDETWIDHYTLELKRVSQCQPKVGQSSRRQNSQQARLGNLCFETFTEFYFSTSFRRCRRSIATNILNSWIDCLMQLSRKVLTLQRKNRCCTRLMCGFTVDENDKEIARFTIRIAPHTPYAPDLAPSTLYLFACLKKKLQGKRFGSDGKVIVATEPYLQDKHRIL